LGAQKPHFGAFAQDLGWEGLSGFMDVFMAISVFE
jgi:hypothetical protein